MKIRLHGSLADEFGSEHTVMGEYIPICLHGIQVKNDNFFNVIKEGNWAVLLDGKSIPEEGVMLGLSNTKQMDIYPELAGSGRGFMLVAGVLLLATGIGSALGAAVLFGAGAAGALGTAAIGTFGLMSASTAILMGAAMLYQGLSPVPDTGDYESMSTDGVQSFMFNGAINVEESGGAVPVVYGKFRVGSTVISSDVSAKTVTV